MGIYIEPKTDEYVVSRKHKELGRFKTEKEARDFWDGHMKSLQEPLQESVQAPVEELAEEPKETKKKSTKAPSKKSKKV